MKNSRGEEVQFYTPPKIVRAQPRGRVARVEDLKLIPATVEELAERFAKIPETWPNLHKEE